MWVPGECIINLFFLAMIFCLENVFIAPYSQFISLPPATVPESWAREESLE